MNRSKLPSLRPSKGPCKAEKRATPNAELGFSVSKTISLSTIHSLCEKETSPKSSKPITECPPKEQQKIFLEKCRACCAICNFASPNAETKQKQIKATLLKHIAAGFTIPHLVRSMQPDSMKEFYAMVAVNIFRPFPQIPPVVAIDMRDSIFDVSWPHLSLIYDALLASFNCPIAPSKINESFLYRLIYNCSSPDDREKTAVRDILHALYTKFMNLREMCRSCVASQFTNDTVSYEMMDFFLSVVSGFNSPLRDDHVNFYYKYFLPLHKSQKYIVFQKPYIQCIIRFISKSFLLFMPTISYIGSHWPQSDRKKQLEYLKELNTLILTFENNVTPKITQIVFRIFGECIESENADVSEAAVDILLSSELGSLTRTNSASVFPLLIAPIHRAAKRHWDNCTRTNAYVVLQYLAEIDTQTFNKANEANKSSKALKAASLGLLRNNWSRVYEIARNTDKSVSSGWLDVLRSIT